MPSIQAIVTPWKDKRELSMLKRQFYDAGSTSPNTILDDEGRGSGRGGSTSARKRRRDACDLVHIWEISGSTPHAIVATADLTNALLFDIERRGSTADKLGIYMSAWTRFIDGMTDTMQIYRVKRSMWDIATELGMPPAFIELRHRCVHEKKPALHEMQRVTRRGLAWLFSYFWTYIENPAALKDDAEIDIVSNEALDQLDVLVRRYLDMHVPDSTGNDQETTKMDDRVIRSTIDGIINVCGDSPEKLHSLAERFINVFLQTSAFQSSENQQPITATDSDTSRLLKLEPILLGVAGKIPLFAAILDEELLASLAAPRSDQSPQTQRISAAAALHIRQSENWTAFRSRMLLHQSSLVEACLVDPQSEGPTFVAKLLGNDSSDEQAAELETVVSSKRG